MCWSSSTLLVVMVTVASIRTGGSLESVGTAHPISKREIGEEPCYIPTHPEHAVLRTYFRLCPNGTDTLACRLVPGTPVTDQWVMYLGCQQGFNLSRETRATVCRDGRWRPHLPSCVLFNNANGTEDQLENFRKDNQTSSQEATKAPCYIPTRPEHGVLRAHHNLCPSGVESPACRLVPGTPVSDQWVMHLGCKDGFNQSREVRTTMCQDGRWRPSLPTCKLFTDFDAKKQYVLGIQNKKIILFDFEDDSPQVRPLRQQTLSQVVTDFAIDCRTGLLYWVEYSNSVIKRSTLDGANLTTFVDSLELSRLAVLTLDWVNRKLYVTTCQFEIKSVHLESGQIETIMSTERQLVWMAVHPTLRKLYWAVKSEEIEKGESYTVTTYERAEGIIYFSLNDSSNGTLVSGIFYEPQAGTIDFSTKELCWIENSRSAIECVHLETGARRVAVTDAHRAIGLSITDDKYFWTAGVSLKLVDKKYLTSKKRSIQTQDLLVDYHSRIELTGQVCPF